MFLDESVNYKLLSDDFNHNECRDGLTELLNLLTKKYERCKIKFSGLLLKYQFKNLDSVVAEVNALRLELSKNSKYCMYLKCKEAYLAKEGRNINYRSEVASLRDEHMSDDVISLNIIHLAQESKMSKDLDIFEATYPGSKSKTLLDKENELISFQKECEQPKQKKNKPESKKGKKNLFHI